MAGAWCDKRTFPDVAHVVPGGSADALRIAMEETKLSHASRCRGRRSIWRGFAESSCSRSVLDVSFKETMHHQGHYFVAAALCGGDGCWRLLPRPMHMYTGLKVGYTQYTLLYHAIVIRHATWTLW